MRRLRICICLLSILVILIGGWIGEEALGAALIALDKTKLRAQDLQMLAAFVLRNYRLNQDHFIVSLAPLVIVLAALPFLDRFVADWETKFWPVLAVIWLVFLAYFGFFLYALMIPFTHMGLAADHEATVVTYASVVLSAVVVVALIALIARGNRR